ncbi:MAG: DUF4867 family protein [Faecalibacterium sp.]|nr:DUF4867 family protein [Ruminococcus sp.]MCM1391838.1 DUF4867 family protein [Ruminococcus sp.]MCM1485702.1 DUF4867 family protein [Faecalibacterium sp.]
MLERLNKVNDVKIYSVFDSEFEDYGAVIDGFDFSPWISYMKSETAVPKQNNIYVPSDSRMEQGQLFDDVQNILYGGMPIQVGYCNGRNSTYNGFEYHKCSEINVAVTDFMLVLGLKKQIKDNKFYVGNEKVFFVPAGTAIEMYQTTLHLSPCKVSDDGFKAVVVLLNGTNTPLEKKPVSDNAESRLLLQKNKWVIAHKDREPLIKQGAYAGLIGENKELKY